MGHRNTQFTDQQGHSHLNPEPCIFYGSVSNFPQPSHHSVVPPPVNQCNYNFHQDGALLYGMPQLTAAQPSHYNPYQPPLSAPRDFPVHVNRGTHSIIGVPTDSYGRSIPYMEDSVRGSFKRKNAEGAPWIYPYHNNNALAGPSSSVESDVALMESAHFPPHEYETVPAQNNNNSRMIQGCFVAPPVQLHGSNNPWFDVHFGSNNGDVSNYAWPHVPLPYVQVLDVSAGVNGANSRSSSSFPNPPHHQGHHNPHQWISPMQQGARGYNVNLQSQVGTSSSRRSSTVSSSSNINPFQEMVDTRPTFLASNVPQMGFRFYQPQQREIVLGSNARHALPHLRILPEDEVAILEIPGYREVGDSIDHHRDMRLDIDHMSYEELLALGEQIGSVRTGLSDEFIRNNLKIRTFASSAARVNLEEEICRDQQINLCVICQTDYKDKEEIGAVDCGHEYHKECIKKWLLVKNTCPVCKSTALSNNKAGNM